MIYPWGHERGYERHVGVLQPAQVRLIARDLASLNSVDVRCYTAGLCYRDEEARRSDRDYVTHFLQAPQAFTSDTAARGHGIVYTIG